MTPQPPRCTSVLVTLLHCQHLAAKSYGEREGGETKLPYVCRLPHAVDKISNGSCRGWVSKRSLGSMSTAAAQDHRILPDDAACKSTKIKVPRLLTG